MSHKRGRVGGQEGFERVAQKQRTRQALLQAARELLGEGRQPTVPEAADRAGISRATAYRYFSRHDEMAQEAVLDAIAAEFERLDLAFDRQADPALRAEQVVVAVLRMVLRNEQLFRTYLALSVTGDGRRGARRVRWLREALAPLASDLQGARFDQLVDALALVCGIETVVVLKDVCGRDDAAIERTARWLVRAILSAPAG